MPAPRITRENSHRPRACAHCGDTFTPSGNVKPYKAVKVQFCSVSCVAKSRALDPAESIKAKSAIDPLTGCWLWQGNRGAKGYNYMSARGRTRTAHRVSYECAHGPFDGSLQVLHHCDTPACVNPNHLFLGDNLANVADRVAKGRLGGAKGERNCKAKLTAAQVLAIRAGSRRQKDIGADYGIQQSVVSAIKRREIWRHVEDAA